MLLILNLSDHFQGEAQLREWWNYISRNGNALLGEICGVMIPKQCERDSRQTEREKPSLSRVTRSPNWSGRTAPL
jgi:hypothetical protein